MHPTTLTGALSTFPIIPSYEWLHKVDSPQKVWISLWEDWQTTYDLPQGYDSYIMSWHNEAINLDRVKQQCQKVDGDIFVLYDGSFYDTHIEGVTFCRYLEWHTVCKKIHAWYPDRNHDRNPTHKFSAICNRLTQSKVWTVTKLLETAASDSIIKLGSWLEGKNVHDWQLTGNHTLDQFTTLFRSKYLNHKINIDAFDNDRDNDQRHTSDPWQYYVQHAAINFTNESFHYSYMTRPDGSSFIYPGPFLTEKTWKCLVGECPIVAVGQFETYRHLEDLGLVFDYGINLGYDRDPGNLTRMEGIIEVIDTLQYMTVGDIAAATTRASAHNRDWIIHGGFSQKCQAYNQITIDQLLSVL